MKKMLIVFLFPFALACSTMSGSVTDMGDKLGNTADGAATASASILNRALAMDLPGLLRAAGEGVANLVKGVVDLVATPVEAVEGAVMGVVAPEAAPAADAD